MAANPAVKYVPRWCNCYNAAQNHYRDITVRVVYLHLIVSGFVAVLLTACSSSSMTPPTYAYKIEDTIRDSKDAKRLIIAHVNFGKPSRLYLQDYEQRVDDILKTYLKKHGYSFVSSALFEQAWQDAVRKHGNPFDQSTGKLNQKPFN